MPLAIALLAVAFSLHAAAEQTPTPWSSTPRADSRAHEQNYRDGIYRVTADYEIPYGYIEPMEVRIVLIDNRISSIAVRFDTIDLTSQAYQSSFANLYKTRVVGRNIDAVDVTRLGGASLTTDAFNFALEKIKQDAGKEQN